MEQMGISKFRATCPAVLKRVQQAGKPIRITRFGLPLAEVVPLSPAARSSNWVGAMLSTGRIVGDIGGPATDLADWNIERQ